MKISDLLTEDLVITNLAGNSKDDIINAVVELVAKSAKVLDKEKVREAVVCDSARQNRFRLRHRRRVRDYRGAD
jgi:mannitol/fructose-specific phosphotransferase system IIA component (Ntr-type)